MEWCLPNFRFQLTLRNQRYSLTPQTPNRDLLTTLAAVGIENVPEICLEIAFEFGHSCDDLEDALLGYASNPLTRPQAKYDLAFDAVDWTSDSPSGCLKAIYLAGEPRSNSTILLGRILDTLNPDFREAALYAASAHSDHEIINRVLRIATETDEHTLRAAGEWKPLTICFRRWLKQGLTSERNIKSAFVDALGQEAGFERYKRLGTDIGPL